MLSFAKILVLGLVIFACVAFAKRLGGGRPAEGRRATAKVKRGLKSETLVKCPVCGVFRPEGLKEPCERSDCPHKL